MPNQNFFNSFCILIVSCMNFITESFMEGAERQKSCNSASAAVSDLPPSVILEILSKLPIKTIIRCKCVCKSWRNLVSDPYFASIYLKNPPFTVIVLSQHRIVVDRLDDASFYFLEIGTNNDVMRTPFNPKALSFPKTGILAITGSCNGLLCLVHSPQRENEIDDNYSDIAYNSQSVYVVNPLLGEFMLLPQVESSEHISDVIYGFGLGANGEQYKVIRIVSRFIFHGLGHDYKVHGEILTLGGVDSEWRYFEDSLIPFYLFPSGVTFNGILHWIGDDRNSGLIFAFDIDQEKGYRIALPPGLRDEPGNIVLAVWNDNLCLTDNNSELQVDVWTMKQYGVTESWTREIILKSSIPSDLSPYSFIPVTTLRNGELLLSCQNEGDVSASGANGQNMISFDVKTKNCSKLEASGGEGTVSFLFGYVPSFFSFGNGFVKDGQ